jgi:hypothetical protein
MWGLDYFGFIKPGAGTVTWFSTHPTDEAAFIDTSTNTVTFTMLSASPYLYTNSGILIARNPTDIDKWSATGGGTMIFTSMQPADIASSDHSHGTTLLDHENTKGSTDRLTPRELLQQASTDPIIKSLSGKTDRPVPLCVDYFFRDRERELRKKLLNNE